MMQGLVLQGQLIWALSGVESVAAWRRWSALSSSDLDNEDPE